MYIAECENISSLEHFVHPDYIPSIKIIILDCCPSLVSVPTEKFKKAAYFSLPKSQLTKGIGVTVDTLYSEVE